MKTSKAKTLISVLVMLLGSGSLVHADDISAGTDVTNLISNADFTNGFADWQGDCGNNYVSSPTTGLIAAESWNKTFDMYQTLQDVPNGVYSLSMSGAYRPGHPTIKTGDLYSNNYAASIYLNSNMVFLPSTYETMIMVQDAVDGENCNITGATPDLEIADENGTLIGYEIHGCIGMANAAAAGRAVSTMVTNVTDGSLTVGIRCGGSGMTYDWTGFSNIHLMYMGTLEQASEQIDKALQCQLDRADKLLNDPVGTAENFEQRPNYSQTLREELTVQDWLARSWSRAWWAMLHTMSSSRHTMTFMLHTQRVAIAPRKHLTLLS